MKCSTCVCSRRAPSWRSRRACGCCAGTSRGWKRASPSSARAERSCQKKRLDMADTMNSTEAVRGHRKQRVGKVISNKMAKTIVVRVERRFPHAKLRKVMTAYKKLYAHDEKSEAKVGDRVRIEETQIGRAHV